MPNAVPPQGIVPNIGVAGVWTLTAPFDTTLAANTSYTCIGVSTLADVASGGIDPYSTYYAPKQLSQAAYAADLANGVCIVSLQSSAGVVQRIPSSYIQQYPAVGGVPYRVMALACTLSAIPDSLDLTAVKDQISALITDTVGVSSTITEVQLSQSTQLSRAQAATVEAARQAVVTNSTTDRSKLLAAQTTIASLQEQIGILETYILANMPPPPVPPTT